jgi:hypothetical protein
MFACPAFAITATRARAGSGVVGDRCVTEVVKRSQLLVHAGVLALFLIRNGAQLATGDAAVFQPAAHGPRADSRTCRSDAERSACRKRPLDRLATFSRQARRTGHRVILSF